MEATCDCAFETSEGEKATREARRMEGEGAAATVEYDPHMYITNLGVIFSLL